MDVETPKRGRIWGLVIAVLAEILAIVLVTVLANALTLPMGHGGIRDAIVLGAQAATAAVVGAILYFVFIRHRVRRYVWVYFLILLAVPAAMDAAAALLIHEGGAKGTASAKAQEDALVRSTLAKLDKAEAIAISKLPGSIDLPTGTAGEPGRLARATKALMLTVQGTYEAFDTRSNALGFPGILSTKRLAEDDGLTRAADALASLDDGLTRAADALASLYGAIKERERRIDVAFAACRKALETANIDAALRRDALERFDRQAAADRQKRTRTTDIELRLLEENQLFVHDLAFWREEWRIEDGILVFNNADALALNREHMKTIMALSQELIEARNNN